MNRITLFVGVLGFALAARAASSQVADATSAKNPPQLKISADGRFLVQDNGKPFFILPIRPGVFSRTPRLTMLMFTCMTARPGDSPASRPWRFSGMAAAATDPETESKFD